MSAVRRANFEGGAAYKLALSHGAAHGTLRRSARSFRAGNALNLCQGNH